MALISAITDDINVISEFEKCLENPVQFYEENNPGQREIDDCDLKTHRWCGMVDCLMKYGYLWEFDWKEPLDEFEAGMQQIKGMPEFDASVLDPDAAEGVDDWLRMLNGTVMPNHHKVIALVDINSDSYPVFVTDEDKFETICSLAEELGHKICKGGSC